MSTIDQPEVRKRTEFLTVLCILTFANVLYHLFSGGMTLAAIGSAQEELAEAQYEMDEALQGQDVPSFMEGFLGGAMDMAAIAAENALALGLGEMLIFLVIGAGAFLMWQLKKVGFYIYTAANVIWLVYNPIVLEFNTWALYSAIPVFIFVAIFVGMYAANLKHLR